MSAEPARIISIDSRDMSDKGRDTLLKRHPELRQQPHFTWNIYTDWSGFRGDVLEVLQ